MCSEDHLIKSTAHIECTMVGAMEKVMNGVSDGMVKERKEREREDRQKKERERTIEERIDKELREAEEKGKNSESFEWGGEGVWNNSRTSCSQVAIHTRKGILL